MYQRIRRLADDAIALQNKNAMDAALREIRVICDGSMNAEQFEVAETVQHQTRNDPPPVVTLKNGIGGTVSVQPVVRVAPKARKAKK